MTIAFFCYFYPNRISGPSNSITNLARFLIGKGMDVDIYTSEKRIKKSFYINDMEIKVFNDFESNYKDYSFVVLSGIFDLNIFHVARTCVKKKIKYLVSPRSNIMLDALKKSSFKKRVALYSYSGYVLKKAFLIHFLSEEEKMNSIFFSNYIVARNGADLNLLHKADVAKKENLITFIGRLDIHHKGLDFLIMALFKIKAKLISEKWRVIICGPDSVGDKAEIESLISKLKLNGIVEICPPATGINKSDLLEKSKLFIHTSRYEGQPQAVLEAMSLGALPITTLGCNLDSHMKGFIPSCPLDIDQIAVSIERGITTFDENLSLKIQTYCLENFTWDLAADEFILACKEKGLLI